MRLKDLYEELLRTEDLFELYDGMTGDFQQDKNKFRQQQEALESFSNNIEINLNDE